VHEAYLRLAGQEHVDGSERTRFLGLCAAVMRRVLVDRWTAEDGHAEDSLGTTALVHEAYLRLAGQEHVDGSERTRFLGLCAAVMRRVLVDRARGTRDGTTRRHTRRARDGHATGTPTKGRKNLTEKSEHT
jgi:uncharacterized protein YecA (UPF0149 family)